MKVKDILDLINKENQIIQIYDLSEETSIVSGTEEDIKEFNEIEVLGIRTLTNGKLVLEIDGSMY